AWCPHRDCRPHRMLVPAPRRDVLGYISRPTLGGGEGNHAKGVRILSAQEIANDRLPISLGYVGLDKSAAVLAEVIHHQIHGDIVGVLRNVARHATQLTKDRRTQPSRPFRVNLTVAA